MASKKKKVAIQVPDADVVNMILDDAVFNKLIGRLTTLINFANGADQAITNLKATLSTVSII